MKKSLIVLFLSTIMFFSFVSFSSCANTKFKLRNNDEEEKNQETEKLNITPEYKKNKSERVTNASTHGHMGVYYDGAKKSKTRCLKLALSSECQKDGHCGWCEENKSCIPGTKKGPLSPCSNGNFYFDDTSAKWSPETSGTINIHTGGKLVITEHPKLDKIVLDPNFRKASSSE